MTQKMKFEGRVLVHRRVPIHLVVFAALLFSALCFTMVLVSAADSDLDPAFDGDGIVITDQGEFEQINDIAIQPDGKIVAAGHAGIFHGSTQEPLSMRVVRYNNDGSLDSTFGSGGIVTTSIGTYAKAWTVALQADGKILVAGRSGTVFQSDFTLVRYNPNGSLDNTFGNAGIVTTSFGAFAQIVDLAVQSDGKIVATGDAPGLGMSVSLTIFTVARYNTDGSLDATFDGDGVSQAVPSGFPLSPAIVPQAIAVQVDQKIAVAGVCLFDTTLKFCVSRYNADGLLDNTFDGDGLVVTEFDSSLGAFANAISVQPDGKLVTGGQNFPPAGGVIPALARYNTDGSLDNSFDGDGRVTTENSLQFEPEALALQSNGKMVIAGRSFPFFDSAVTVFRYDSDGSIDETFGNSGIVTTSVGTVHSAAAAVAVQADGRIVAGGYGNFTANEEAIFSDFALVRYGLAADNPPTVTITGGGWIDSPQGAFVPTPTSTGKASFGFVAKSHNNASAPTGSARFQFNAGGLNFHSTSYDSLVVSGNKSQLQGVGTIDGAGGYRFRLTCVDGDQPGGDGHDRFRIKIWSDSNTLIYDNQLNAPDGADPTTVLSGGSIRIHH